MVLCYHCDLVQYMCTFVEQCHPYILLTSMKSLMIVAANSETSHPHNSPFVVYIILTNRTLDKIHNTNDNATKLLLLNNLLVIISTEMQLVVLILNYGLRSNSCIHETDHWVWQETPRGPSLNSLS